MEVSSLTPLPPGPTPQLHQVACGHVWVSWVVPEVSHSHREGLFPWGHPRFRAAHVSKIGGRSTDGTKQE